jgi:type IV pilus assembly protein PilQ
VTKVPLLGDIPILGNLFKNKSTSSTRQELLIFITPRTIGDRGVSR